MTHVRTDSRGRFFSVIEKLRLCMRRCICFISLRTRDTAGPGPEPMTGDNAAHEETNAIVQ
jgi:hypothetical protein